MAEIESAEVTVVLSQVLPLKQQYLLKQYQVLADLVQGEFQQLETKEDEGQVNNCCNALYLSHSRSPGKVWALPDKIFQQNCKFDGPQLSGKW